MITLNKLNCYDTRQEIVSSPISQVYIINDGNTYVRKYAKLLILLVTLIVQLSISTVVEGQPSASADIISRTVGEVEVSYIKGQLIMQTDMIQLPENIREANFDDAAITDIDLKQTLASFGASGIKKIFTHKYSFPDLDNIYLIAIGVDPLDAAQQLLRFDLRAQPNFIYQLARTPNDIQFNEQWGLHNVGQTNGRVDADIDAPEAWDTQTGSNNIVIAITDTGIDYNHPDIATNIWRNTGEIPNNRIDDDMNGFVDDDKGWDFINNDNDPMDDNGHGTHVAGIAAAVTNNNIGIAGVCWNCKLMALKVCSPFCESVALGGAVIYGVDNGARVISSSLGGSYYDPLEETVFRYAANRDTVAVAAAMNSGLNMRVFPAAFDTVVAVAGTEHNDQKDDRSNYGSWVDVAAPGKDILSTVPTRIQPSGYVLMSGTSMATPHVSGLIALLLSQNPFLNRIDIINILRTTTDLPVGTGYHIGAGRINAQRALQMATSTIPNANFDASLDDLAFLGGIIGVKGTASGSGFQSYTLEYGAGNYPSAFTTISSGTTPVINDVLGLFDTNTLQDGVYTLRLTVRNTANVMSRDVAVINKGCAVPVGPIMRITQPTILCNSGNTVYMDINFYLDASDILFDCNGATLRANSPLAPAALNIEMKRGITIQNCIIRDYPTAISLYGTTSMIVSNNRFLNNRKAIDFTIPPSPTGVYSQNNRIVSNTFINNNIGISNDEARDNNNYFLNNNFITNNVHASMSGNNIWSDQAVGGNYWDDHNCVDTNIDGICDTPYTINSGNQDRLPLVHPSLLFIDGIPQLGRSFRVKVEDPLNSNKPYIVLSALSRTQPIQLPDQRYVYLTPDALFFTLLLNPGNPTVQNTMGILDTSGRATVVVNVPNEPILYGLNLYFALVVLDQTAPSGIGRISHTLSVQIA